MPIRAVHPLNGLVLAVMGCCVACPDTSKNDAVEPYFVDDYQHLHCLTVHPRGIKDVARSCQRLHTSCPVEAIWRHTEHARFLKPAHCTAGLMQAEAVTNDKTDVQGVWHQTVFSDVSKPVLSPVITA